MKLEVAVLGSPYLTVIKVFVDVKRHGGGDSSVVRAPDS